MAWIAQFDTQMLRDGYTPTEAMVYGYLWWHIWKSKAATCVYPSIWLMKKTLNISRISIIRAVDKLEKKWLIEVTRRYKQNNGYYVTDFDKYIPCSNYNPEMMYRLNS